MKKLLIAAFMVFLLPLTGRAVTTTNTLTKQAVDTSWTIDLQQLGVNSLSARATYSSATIPSKTFTDGAPSAGVLTVGAITSLSTAAASDTITITSTSGIAGAYILMPGYQLRCGADWSAGPTVSSAATSLAAALNKNPLITAVPVAGVITITAKSVGAWANSIPIASSNGNVVVATPLMTGGADAAVVTIHGVALKEGKDWHKGASTGAAATSLASAINAAPGLAGFITATASSSDVNLASVANGVKYNFSLASSVSDITVSGPLMTGGADMGYAIGSGVISIPSHGFTVGLPVLYTEASGFPVAPLVNQTTYYIIPVGANSVELATTVAHAIAGDSFMVISGSNSPSHLYTLAPLAISGISTFTWMVSNDGLSYSALSGADVVAFATPFTAAVKTWDLGDINYRYLKLDVEAPDTGAINLATIVNGFMPSDFVRKAGSTMTGDLVMDGTSKIVGSGAGLTAVPAASVASGTLGAAVRAVDVAPTVIAASAIATTSPDIAGRQYTISNGVVPYQLCIATGTSAGAMVLVSSTSHCQ